MNARPIKHGKGFRIRWLDQQGVRRSKTVHVDYKSACLVQRQLENEAEEIRRGLRLAPTEPRSFDQLCDHYLKFYSAEKRNWRADHTNIARHLRPHFGRHKLHEIGEEHLSEYRMSKRHLSKKTLHTHLTLLGTMLRVAQDKNWLLKLPKIKKPKIVLLEQDFHYLRTDDEIRRFLVAAKEEHRVGYYLYATAIYTGLREGELAGLRRDDIDLERNLIMLRGSYDGPTKNCEARPVPILKILRPLLLEWLLINPGPVVFPNEHGTMLGRSARLFQEVFHRVLKRAGFPEEVKDGRTYRYITFHDLRHTFASHWMMKGGDIFKLQKILGHKTVQMTMRYSHLSPHAYDTDYDRFGSVAPGSQPMGKVIPLVDSKIDPDNPIAAF
jgi:integrase